MNPLYLAAATFGIQKLRGKSTRMALKDAALIGGLSYGIGALAGGFGAGAAGQTAGTTLAGGTGTGIGTGTATTAGATTAATTGAGTAAGTAGTTAATKPNLFQRLIGTPDVKNAAGKVIKEGTGFRGLSTPTKLVAGATALPLVTAAFTDDEVPQPPFTEEDYERAYAEQREATGPFERATYTQTASGPSLYNYGSDSMYRLKEGGIVSALPKFNVGGINYLPSKVSHDENDVNNYVRASGYVEDGSGNGDKDEDTMLAQLADGEFVSRADAILGAGIMEGASPKNMKEMRKKGAAFFYDQQAKFKRVYDLLNASRKDN